MANNVASSCAPAAETLNAQRRRLGTNGSSIALDGASEEGSSLDLRRQLCDQNVFVFHLPCGWGEAELRREFGCHGEVLRCKVIRRPDGTSKGYGFVCYATSSAAFHAVEVMNGRSYGGKRLKVSLKKTPEECVDLQVQKLMEICNMNQPYDRERDCTLFVFHLPAEWQNRELQAHFESFGTLIAVRVAKKRDGSSRGYGFVTYDHPKCAALAIVNMNGMDVGCNKRLKVQLKQSPASQQRLPGCSIFIFHIPSDWTDCHLRQHFSHFGRIFAATVQRDMGGNSRGYGFVSFERRQSAVNSVIGMDGFCVGRKRLKVALKRGEKESFAVFPAVYDDRQGPKALAAKPEEETTHCGAGHKWPTAGRAVASMGPMEEEQAACPVEGGGVSSRWQSSDEFHVVGFGPCAAYPGAAYVEQQLIPASAGRAAGCRAAQVLRAPRLTVAPATMHTSLPSPVYSAFYPSALSAELQWKLTSNSCPLKGRGK